MLVVSFIITILGAIAGIIYWIFRVISNLFNTKKVSIENVKTSNTLIPYKKEITVKTNNYKQIKSQQSTTSNDFLEYHELSLQEKKVMNNWLKETIEKDEVLKQTIFKIENKLNIKFKPQMREEIPGNTETLENEPFVPLSDEKISEIVFLMDMSPITTIIEMQKSGEKGKNYYLDLEGNKCTTEQAFKSYYENQGFKVMRGEVMFWQAIACLSFFEEIYCTNWDVVFNDIPYDMFKKNNFYNDRKEYIENKYEYLKNGDLKFFINSQIDDFGCFNSRLYYNGDIDCIEYIKSDIVQEFLTKIPNEYFADICYNIVKNGFYNRAGLPDFVIWDEHSLKFVETKRFKEKIRDSQSDWIEFFRRNNIPIEIVRIKGI